MEVRASEQDLFAMCYHMLLQLAKFKAVLVHGEKPCKHTLKLSRGICDALVQQ